MGVWRNLKQFFTLWLYSCLRAFFYARPQAGNTAVSPTRAERYQMEGNRIDELKTALWSSDPWVADNHSFFCLHCGMKYNGDVPQGTHHANCIWLVNFQEVESGLTPRVPDVATCLCGGEYYTDKVLGVVCCRCQAPRR